MKTKIIFFSLCIPILFSVYSTAQKISPSYFGQNAWYLSVDPTLTSSNFSTGFDGKLSDIAGSGVKYMRIGGIDPNFIPLYQFDGSANITDITKLTHLIIELRANGIEPIIEVGFNPVCSGYPPNSTWTSYTRLGSLTTPTAQAQQATLAGNLVTAVNNWCAAQTSPTQPPVLNWIIANEPDHPQAICTNNWPASPGAYNYSSSSIAPYIIAFSTAMKTAFPSPALTIIGPELATYGDDLYGPGNAIMNDLIGGTYTIMGAISGGAANGQYFVDVISFHYYPNDYILGPPDSRIRVIADPTNCTNGFRNDLKARTDGSGNACSSKRGIVDMITSNTSRTSDNLQIACTEFNLPNTPSPAKDESTNYVGMIEDDYGYRSFIGGQWMAEVLLERIKCNGLTLIDTCATQSFSPNKITSRIQFRNKKSLSTSCSQIEYASTWIKVNRTSEGTGSINIARNANCNRISNVHICTANCFCPCKISSGIQF